MIVARIKTLGFETHALESLPLQHGQALNHEILGTKRLTLTINNSPRYTSMTRVDGELDVPPGSGKGVQ